MCSGHTASFKIGVSKVQDFENFELSPINLSSDLFTKVGCASALFFSSAITHPSKSSKARCRFRFSGKGVHIYIKVLWYALMISSHFS